MYNWITLLGTWNIVSQLHVNKYIYIKKKKLHNKEIHNNGVSHVNGVRPVVMSVPSRRFDMVWRVRKGSPHEVTSEKDLKEMQQLSCQGGWGGTFQAEQTVRERSLGKGVWHITRSPV